MAHPTGPRMEPPLSMQKDEEGSTEYTTTLSGERLSEDALEDIDVSPRKKNEKHIEHADTQAEGQGNSLGNVLWVDWDGPDDPENPKNWTYRQRWLITVIVSSFTFISPVSSSMVAPASAQIAQHFNITSTVLVAMTTSVFVLGYSVGPLVIGPLSEIYGRSKVLQISNLFFLAWNIACGFAQNKTQLIVFRLLAGLGGSAPLSVGGGVLGDVWRAEERGKALAIYSLAPLLGPVIGPVCGSWIAERSIWRWVFWSTSIVDALIQLSGLFFLRETYAPFLLEEKARRVRRERDAAHAPHRPVMTVYEITAKRSWQTILRVALTRPFQLFGHETIIQLLGVYMAFVYGIFYIFLTNIPNIFGNIYHENLGVGGLHYIALGVGLTLAGQLNGRNMDKIHKHFKARNGGVGEPEFRLPSMFPSTILMPFGLLLAGWAAEKNLHWIVTDIGMALVGASMILTFQSVQTYVVDAFTLHAASALAAVSCLRSIAGFGFPLFAPVLYEKLGYGKGNTVLACLAIGLGCPAPFLLWVYGKRIRTGSKYAHKGRAAPTVDNVLHITKAGGTSTSSPAQTAERQQPGEMSDIKV